jgi:hypothetical protein
MAALPKEGDAKEPADLVLVWALQPHVDPLSCEMTVSLNSVRDAVLVAGGVTRVDMWLAVHYRLGLLSVR